MSNPYRGDTLWGDAKNLWRKFIMGCLLVAALIYASVVHHSRGPAVKAFNAHNYDKVVLQQAIVDVKDGICGDEVNKESVVCSGPGCFGNALAFLNGHGWDKTDILHPEYWTVAAVDDSGWDGNYGATDRMPYNATTRREARPEVPNAEHVYTGKEYRLRYEVLFKDSSGTTWRDCNGEIKEANSQAFQSGLDDPSKTPVWK